MVILTKVVYFTLVFVLFGLSLAVGYWVTINYEQGRAFVDLLAAGIGSLALIPAIVAFTGLARWEDGKLAFYSTLDDPEPIVWLVMTPLLLAVATGFLLVARWFEFVGM